MILTAFQQRVEDEVQEDWTSLYEEIEFLDAVQFAYPDRVEVYECGRSYEDNPIRCVVVTNPSSTPPEKKQSVLLVGLQHGDEPAGREAVLQRIHDLASSSDPAIVGYMDHVRVVCIPTVNPDRMRISTEGQRNNAQGIDINRTHLSLATPEVLAVQGTITRYMPSIVIDLHETALRSSFRMEFNRGLHTEIDEEISSDAQYLVDELKWVMSTIGAEGGTFSPTHPNRGNLSNTAGLRGAISLLFETMCLSDPPRTDRVLMHRTALDYVFSWHMGNRESVAERHRRVLLEIAESGKSGESFDLQNGVTVHDLIGYRVGQEDWPPLSNHGGVIGLGYYKNRSDYVVPAGQKVRGILPMAIDPSATTEATPISPIVSASRLSSLPRSSVSVESTIRKLMMVCNGEWVAAKDAGSLSRIVGGSWQ